MWDFLTVISFRKNMTCNNLKIHPMKAFLNYITTKSISTTQVVYSVCTFTQNPPTLWGQKNNFCGMWNLLIICSRCVKKRQHNQDKWYPVVFLMLSCSIYMSASLCQSLARVRGKGTSRSANEKWGKRWTVVKKKNKGEGRGGEGRGGSTIKEIGPEVIFWSPIPEQALWS